VFENTEQSFVPLPASVHSRKILLGFIIGRAEASRLLMQLGQSGIALPDLVLTDDDERWSWIRCLLGEGPASVRFGRAEIDFRARTATVAGQPVHMSDREFDLVQLLVRHRGEVLSRRMILQRLWKPGYKGTIRTVDNFIKRLRRKLEPGAEPPRHFITVRGAGYRFEG
jgi:DNA-binding response OmpR family regulator